jgi:rod shape-determining protein MreD
MKVDPVARTSGSGSAMVPQLLTLALALVTVIPIDIPDYAAVTPDFLLIAVYHWSLYRPNDLPYSVVFMIAVVEDLLTAGPPGLIELVLLLVRWAVLNTRRLFVGRTFPFVWGGFAVAAMAVSLASWLLGSILEGAMQEPRSVAFRTVLTVAFYPIMTPLFARAQKLIAA